jgi:DNA-3-methyladenine glycosylase II
MSVSRFELALPQGFRLAEFLAFHRRDPEMTAERVGVGGFAKAMMWNGQPALLTLDFRGNVVSVVFDGDQDGQDGQGVVDMVRRMLGLTQPVETFEGAFLAHPHMGRLIAMRRGLRVPVTATPFEALTWAVTGQQISVAVAVSLRRKLILAAGPKVAGGFHAYPGPAQVAALAEDDLGRLGFSRAKARTLVDLARRICDGSLDLDRPAVQVGPDLLQVSGVGPWTVNYTLLRGYGWLDGSLHGDVAVRRQLQLLLGLADKPTLAFTEQWLAAFAPWRALAAAHLWAQASVQA